MKNKNTAKPSFFYGKVVGKVCMILLLGAILFTGCALGTGYDSEEVSARTALPAAADLPTGTWYTHLTGASAAYNTVIDLTANTITYTGSLEDYDYVANIVDSYAFDAGSGAYVVTFTTAPVDIEEGKEDYYYVMYYTDYIPAAPGTAAEAKMADAYSTAYDPETGYTSVRRVYVTPPTESDLEEFLDIDVGWTYVSPYYLGVTP